MSKHRPRWLEPSTVLTESSDLPDSLAGWRSYLQYLEFLATDALAKKELAAERMSRGWCLGDRGFKNEMRKAAAKQSADLERFSGRELAEARRAREERWEELLQALAGLAKIDFHALPEPKSHPDKVLLAAALKGGCSVSNGWLAKRLQMGQLASASQFVRRWMLDAKKAAASKRCDAGGEMRRRTRSDLSRNKRERRVIAGKPAPASKPARRWRFLAGPKARKPFYVGAEFNDTGKTGCPNRPDLSRALVSKNLALNLPVTTIGRRNSTPLFLGDIVSQCLVSSVE